ncbi:hypothetical protein ACFIJ5_10305 [Haloimpatiens sp. FM7330]|uniref:hypothetical protein n=1 Tax=Haloimpatiens sp. FM7330 TaxID=3298610 RepID=UPI0036376906
MSTNEKKLEINKFEEVKMNTLQKELAKDCQNLNHTHAYAYPVNFLGLGRVCED